MLVPSWRLLLLLLQPTRKIEKKKNKNTHLAQQSNCVLGWLIYLFLFRLKARQWIGHRSMGDTKQPARQHHKQQAAKFSPNMLVHLSIYKHILYIHTHIYFSMFSYFHKKWNLNLNDCRLFWCTSFVFCLKLCEILVAGVHFIYSLVCSFLLAHTQALTASNKPADK